MSVCRYANLMALSFLEPQLWVIGDRSLRCENRNFRLLSPVTLILTRLHLYTNMICPPGRYTGCTNMNFLRQGFRKLLSDRQTDRRTDKLRLVTSSHVTKMAVTPIDAPQSTNTCCTQT